MVFSTQQILALKNTESALMGVVQRHVQPGLRWNRPPHLPPATSPSCEPQEQGSCRGNTPLLTSSQLGQHTRLWQSLLQLSSTYPISATESDPKGMCGNEQKGGERGGTASKQL